jgi:signal transduction histidine kinase
MAPETNAILAQIHDIHETLVLSDGDFNRVYRVLPGLDEKPALLLQVDDPRLISAKGEKAVRFALLSILGASLVILIVLIIGLQRMVLIPLKRLTDHTVAIGKSNDLSVNLTLNRKDEIGILSREYDHMVERLAKTQKVLMEQSYHSGMAEVAIGVLHNVGNVLNSVNVSCTLIMDQLRESSIGDVSEVAGLMNRPDGDLCHFLKEDSRGQMIPIFIASLATVLEEERQAMLRETKALHGRIEHIKEIVVMQQNYGQISTVSESILPEQLMEGSVKLNADELAQHNVTVQREYQAVPSITVNKHKVLQILINLINNAKNACTDCGCKEKNITLRIFSSTPDSVKMQVADNGIGITRENLTQIFQYGFTTRKSGRGFGLHSSALTAKELGCSLTANSDGPGFGATFTLELPCHPGDNK